MVFTQKTLKVVFADPPFGRESKGEAVTESPNLGILYIIGYARERLSNIEFTYLEPFLSMEEHLQKIQQIKPDVYALSFTTPRRDLSFETIAKVKATELPMLILAGGAHPTIDPQDVLKYTATDVCIRGEGEETTTELLQKIQTGQPITDVAGTVNQKKNNGLRPLLKNLDFFPAWDLIDFENYDIAVSKKKRMAYLLPIRGCPNYCTYCSNPVWKLEKPWIRQRSPKNIAEEIHYLYNRGIREIYLRSDTFNVDIKWCLQVCEEIKKLNLKGMTFQCNLRADKLNDELAQHLQDINIWLVHIGLESANDRVLRGIGKNATQADNIHTLELLKKHKIKVYGFLMLYNAWETNGKLEYETPQEVNTTLEFAKNCLRDNLIEYISWSITNPLIGSKLYDIAKKHDIAIHNVKIGNCMRLPGITEQQMVEHVKQGMILQLLNGIQKGMITKKSYKRAAQKAIKILNM
ncbi:radical SAM protein [Candidatus Bathycorpusculum sp.]|uniref:B12-binding domain-containing radical SAM protein n=1 Tax=Candidatus Bathycorpusculum sp. TaxID=2994959 RepID=UPI00282C5593|nr:B12-binding domain-containing radical SAM protein [Candidatus Termitimicrobium sp.]MCL2431743.1 B12-binding domain-containing radical SAM protein [Candidatus Termitimicrobium sp.]